MFKLSKAVTALLLLNPSFAGAADDTCAKFKDIYASGTELCEVMWADSFEVVEDEDKGYTMWFFDMETNPNDAVTRSLFGNDTQVDQCHLNYFHKEVPSPEDEAMTECHPWKNNACCDSTTVVSPDALNEAYGPGYEWDRCGPMSEACERFFVMEACLYECEPSAGLYRKFNDSQQEHLDFNDWQLHKMPIKKSFCDSFYTACYNDFFCGAGDYFECQKVYEENLKVTESENDTGLMVGLGVAGALAFIGLIFAAYLVSHEKRGKPVFAPPVEITGVAS